jgi:hypothetical protein
MHLFESLQRDVPVFMMYSKLGSATYLHNAGTRKHRLFQMQEQSIMVQVQQPAWQYSNTYVCVFLEGVVSTSLVKSRTASTTTMRCDRYKLAHANLLCLC